MSDAEAPAREAVAREREAIRRLAAATPPPPPALLRAARALHALGRWVVAGGAAGEALAAAARELEALVRRVGADRMPATRFGDPAPARPGPFHANARGSHPLLGSVSPVAPPIALRVDGERIVADVTFDVRFEGNAGWVHGGFVAAGFDIVALQAARLSGRAGPTGTLEVRFVAPTPIGVPLRYEAWFARAEGRVLHSEARLLRLDDGSPTARARAAIVTPK